MPTRRNPPARRSSERAPVKKQFPSKGGSGFPQKGGGNGGGGGGMMTCPDCGEKMKRGGVCASCGYDDSGGGS
jgi:hypothetical protein